MSKNLYSNNLLSNYNNYLITKGYSSKTAASMVRTAKQFTNWSEAENLTPSTTRNADILGYIKTLKQRGVKQRTQQMYVADVKHYFNYLIFKGAVEENPASNIVIKGIKRKVLYDLFTAEELDRIYKSYPNELPTQRRNKIILSLIIYQGLRSEELAALKPEDLKLREGKIQIHALRRTAGRTLELKSYQIIDLQDYIYVTRNELLKLTGKTTDKLFTSSGRGSSLHGLMQKLTAFLKKQHLRLTTLKQLRASVIVNWLKQHNLRKVQYLAGHKYISSTESYLVNDMEGLKEDVTKYHPIG